MSGATVAHKFTSSGPQFNTFVTVVAIALTLTSAIFGPPAFALSELKPAIAEKQLTETDKTLPPLEGPQVGPDGGLPQPAPVIRRSDEDQFPSDNARKQDVEPASPTVEIVNDLTRLPKPAARMRELIINAAKTGDPEQLRMLLGTGPTATRLSFGGVDGDPIEYLKSISGDGEGREILAILLDLLDNGFVHLDEGTAEDTYVWPHFVTSDLNELSPAEEVELLRIVTAGDLDDMRSFGGYNFFRIGISPDGQWQFFLAGD